MARRSARARVHPIEFEVFRHLYLSIADEMGATLRQTGFSPNIKERLDYSCAVYDSQGDTIAQGDHMPVHLGAMPLSVRAAIDAVRMQPGDAVMLNDPYRGGTHLPDITLVSPVFLAGDRRPSFYVANRAHHSDIGGMSPGSMPVASELFQEGLILPPVRLVARGRVVGDVLDIVLANVRTPDERRGDLAAQIAASRVALSRLAAAAARYGRRALVAYGRALQDHTARAVGAVVHEIPDGTYTFDDVLDDDGFSDRPIRIAVSIRVAGRRITMDFSGSAPETRGSVNANDAITLSACLYALRCLVREDVLYNAGVARPLRVIAPAGTVVNARRPAAVAGGNVETSQRITDVVFGALGRALPDRLPAASQGTMNNVTFGGVHPVTGRRFAYYETIGGGMGGRPGRAGLSAVHTHMSNTRNTPIEAIEHDLPMWITTYRVRAGSGGRGEFPGGDGIVREYEALADMDVTILSDRRVHAPYGVLGGEPGQSGRNVVVRDGHERVLPGKIQFRLASGDRLRIETPGGGGYGRAVAGATS
jgi:N-methylhydantoinase B/oxoprolinase/acetone carboxylase alpha subunit